MTDYPTVLPVYKILLFDRNPLVDRTKPWRGDDETGYILVHHAGKTLQLGST